MMKIEIDDRMHELLQSIKKHHKFKNFSQTIMYLEEMYRLYVLPNVDKKIIRKHAESINQNFEDKNWDIVQRDTKNRSLMHIPDKKLKTYVCKNCGLTPIVFDVKTCNFCGSKNLEEQEE